MQPLCKTWPQPSPPQIQRQSKSSKILDACGHFLLSQAKIMPEALPLQFDCKSAAN